VTVLRDATRHKRAEEVLRQAAEEAEASNRAKSTFLANMSHELRTPLNAVIGFSNILRKNRDGSFSERDVEYLERIVSNGKHLLALINDVLDLSKIEAGRMDVVLEEVHLDGLIREVHHSFELQASRKGIELLVEVPPAPDPVQADGHRLRQVLINLVGNAVKFTSEGHVALRLLADDEGRRPRRIEVEDTGIGIPEHRLAEVFDPFQQVDASTSRKFGGTGLGLAISRSLCELMHFRLSATSDDGEGSTFIVDLQPGDTPGQEAGVPAGLALPGADDEPAAGPGNG
jgi:signal transduction histidine kinase